jgi:hypothetical protein
MSDLPTLLSNFGAARAADDRSMRDYQAYQFAQKTPKLAARPMFPMEDPTLGATPESRMAGSNALSAMGYVPTGQPWTLDLEHNAPASIATLFAPAFQNEGTGTMTATVTPRQVFSTFYGGDKNFDSELQKAKAAYEADQPLSKTADLFMGYGGVDLPVKVNVKDSGESYHQLGLADVLTPRDGAYTERIITQDPELAAANNFIPSDFKSQTGSQNYGPFVDNTSMSDAFYGTLLHEIGHEITGGPLFGSTFGGREQHMADSAEMANQLGQIQREAYATFGKRFSREAFGEYLKSQSGLLPDQQFQQFSTEPKRALREIMQSYRQEISPEAYKRSLLAIPYFAQAGGQEPSVA